MSAIKSIRMRLGITQAALAAGIGCTQGNVGHYENKGQTIPPNVARRLIAFAAGRGVHLSYEDVYGTASVTLDHGQAAIKNASHDSTIAAPVSSINRGAQEGLL